MKNKIKKEGTWVIGDVHGEYDMLVGLLDRLPKDAAICFVGDLVDRGEKSAHVVDLVLKNGYYCTLGNHELMMIKSTNGNLDDQAWEQCGGDKTIKNYWHFKKEWEDHMQFIMAMPYFHYFEIDGHKPLVVSHSYIHHIWKHKDYKYTEKEAEDILWRHMNNPKYFEPKKQLDSGIFNIFGHYPVPEPIIAKTYAMIDTGATYKNNRDLGRLSAIHYPSMKILEYGVEDE